MPATSPQTPSIPRRAVAVALTAACAVLVLTANTRPAWAAGSHHCHVSLTNPQKYVNVLGTVKATGISCKAAKPVVKSAVQAPLTGFNRTFTRKVAGRTWHCKWKRTSDFSTGYHCTSGSKKLSWNYGQ